ncbi:hypothetical protein AWC38_SpisGene14935 [Stylophora pistillata]|uniref:Uncharacterized protein n=2 Tax=Stylophora pistillata TaxID=50429 RepID=A0A2B4RSM2_STYPI|nr:hypothetical protein AWC38_SpisGene14935 [Stylophora pistillata]
MRGTSQTLSSSSPALSSYLGLSSTRPTDPVTSSPVSTSSPSSFSPSSSTAGVSGNPQTSSSSSSASSIYLGLSSTRPTDPVTSFPVSTSLSSSILPSPSTAGVPNTSQTSSSSSPASSNYLSSSSVGPTVSAMSSLVSSSSSSSSSPAPPSSSPPPTNSTALLTNSSNSTTEQGSAPGNATTTAQPEKKSTTIVGLVISYFAILVLVAGTYHWMSRQKKTKVAKRTESEIDASALCGSAATVLGETKETEVGITHQTFAEDSESPENATAPESQEATVLFSEDTKF